MRVQFTVVGGMPDEVITNVFVNLDAVPAEGQTVTLPGLPAHLSSVRTVAWYPMGDPEDDDYELSDQAPFVYVVLGPRRPLT